MKIVKFGYMNDEHEPIIIKVLDSRYDAFTSTGDFYVTLKPCEYKEFEIHMPDDAILYVKKWPSMVMLSYYEQTVPAAQPQSVGAQPPGESL